MKRISILLLAAMLASACQKENSPFRPTGTSTHPTGGSTQLNQTPSGLDGTYAGPYLALSGSPSVGPVQKTVQVIFSGASFQSGDLNVYSSVGAGSVQVSGSVLDFTNIDAFPNGYVFTNAGLSGGYNYTVKGDSLLLNKQQNGGTITYKLKKQ